MAPMVEQRGRRSGSLSSDLQGTAEPISASKTRWGLGGNREDRAGYKTIQRNLRDLVHNARIDWEIPWKDTPAAAKAALFEVARERHPYLAEFQNDWATEEIVKQYIKNKRNNAYKKEYITVPTKYAYLKANAAKRDPSAPRGKKSRAKKVDAAKARAKSAIKPWPLNLPDPARATGNGSRGAHLLRRGRGDVGSWW
ncbi:hypothetical protein C8J57DRAFT_156438 [Mycena rebaudengoi]|nr:hypothetical protein C8J57DRAFT_156438 [Mycena rebaudengoi]